MEFRLTVRKYSKWGKDTETKSDGTTKFVNKN